MRRLMKNQTGFTGVKAIGGGIFEAYVSDATRGNKKTYCGRSRSAEGAYALYCAKYEEIYDRPPSTWRNGEWTR